MYFCENISARLWNKGAKGKKNVKYSIRNVVSNFVEIMYGARWVLDIARG